MDGAAEPDEIMDQRLGLFARQLAIGGAQVPEPAKAIKLARPVGRWRHDFKGRFRAKLGEFAGQPEMAVIDFGGEARVRGPQLLGRKQKLLGL